MIQQAKWSDFKIIPLTETARKEEISDEVYFSKSYSDYISNSRLKLINPDQEGSPQKYKEKQFQESSQSLMIGSSVHQLFLQPDEFTLVEGLNKPSAKLGSFIDRVKYYRRKGHSIAFSLENASNDVEYYAGKLSRNRLKTAVNKGLFYYLNSQELGPQHIVLCDADTEVVKNCLTALNSNTKILNLVQGIDWAGDSIDSFNEDAMFLDVQVNYLDKQCILPLKMKADNWTIDTLEQILTLNDLKTTGKPLPFFMQPEYGSFEVFHYARQFAMYSMILKYYCAKNYGFTKEWKFNGNVIVSETIPPHRAGCFKVPPEQIRKGMIELFQLLKRIAFYEIHGWSEDDVEFI